MDLATSEEETSEEEIDTSGIIDQTETSIKASLHRTFASTYTRGLPIVTRDQSLELYISYRGSDP